MSYSLGMSHIDEKKINSETIIEFCKSNPDYKFDESKTWTNLYDAIVLFKKEDNSWDYLLGFNNNDKYAECISPDNKFWDKLCQLAEHTDLFIFGEENEIYYVPQHGVPKIHLDFELAKESYKKHGYNLDLILKEATVEE